MILVHAIAKKSTMNHIMLALVIREEAGTKQEATTFDWAGSDYFGANGARLTMAKNSKKFAPLRPTLLEEPLPLLPHKYCLCLGFFHSSFIKCSWILHKKSLSILGNAAQLNARNLSYGTFGVRSGGDDYCMISNPWGTSYL